MRSFLAAVAGLFAAVGFASAQAPKFTPAGNYATAPIPTNTGFTPAGNLAPGAVLQTANFGGAAVVASGPGCSTCAATPKYHPHLIGVGTAMPVKCSCLAAERTFIFGSCNQFFAPGRTCTGDCIRYGGNCNTGGGCGSGYGCGGGASERHPCAGVTSYLNR